MNGFVVVHTPSLGKMHKAYIQQRCTKEEMYDVQDLYLNGYRLTLVGVIKDSKMSVGLSICTYPDNFSKDIGIHGDGDKVVGALARALENPIHTFDVTGDKVHRFCTSLLQQVHSEVASDVTKYKKLLSKKVNG